MAEQPDQEDTRVLETLTQRGLKWATSPWALEVVFAFLGLWLVAGLFLKFSEIWREIIYTVSAVITLIMVFLLVRTQAKDVLAIQVKLNEIIAAVQGANNQLINIENLSEGALAELSKRYEVVATKVASEEEVSTEAIASHEIVAEEEEGQSDG
jgi:low affinity Fe/Cu permease